MDGVACGACIAVIFVLSASGADPPGLDTTDLAELQTFIEEQNDQGKLSADAAEVLLRRLYMGDQLLYSEYLQSRSGSADEVLERLKRVVDVPDGRTESNPNSRKAEEPETRSTSPNKLVVEEYTSRLQVLYRKHDPTKLATVDSLLRRSVGKEHALYTKVANKYKEPVHAAFEAPEDSMGIEQTMSQIAKLPEKKRALAVKLFAQQLQTISTDGHQAHQAEMDAFFAMLRTDPAEYSKLRKQVDADAGTMLDVMEEVMKYRREGHDSTTAESTTAERGHRPGQQEGQLFDTPGQAGLIPEEGGGARPAALGDLLETPASIAEL